MTQGQSNATPDKERRIWSALSVGMRIFGCKFAGSRYNYWHFDANSGCGFNHDASVIGSPVVFWQLADLLLPTVSVVGLFADINEAHIRDLGSVLAKNTRWNKQSALFPYDNDEVLDVFGELIRRYERPCYAIGSVLVDPNGWFYKNGSGQGAPVDRLVGFTREFPRIDIILNLNLRTYQLQRGHMRRGHPNQNVLSPTQVLQQLNKQYWLVAKTFVGQGRFLLAVGRNVKTGSHPALGLHTIESAAGRAVMIDAEGGRQGDLLGRSTA